MTRFARNLLLFFAIIIASFSVSFALECGYESCNKVKPDALNIHIISHSHDDVGWLKTVQQYYDGSNRKSQYANVSQIISSVVEALKDHPERRFIQVESFFFHKWWHDQTEDVKKLVHRLVANGQFEFTGGAWSMNDEAAADFHSIIEQFTFGLKFLNDTFGMCGLPKIGWQIDPFGHSNEMASLFAQMGYDGLFLTRIDYRDKDQRLSDKKMEMMWQGSHNLGNESNIFTSVMFNHYTAPEGFCFDATCSDESIEDDPENPNYNLEQKLKTYKRILTSAAKHFKTNNLLVPMGGDFNYMEAHNYYKNLDALMGGFSKFPQEFQGKPINIFYSTPACYVKAVNDVINAEKIELPVETNDFFPYGTDWQTYWTGYFSSRPASKRSARKSLNLLQVHKQLAAFTHANNESELFALQNAVGIMQHHDAITGTEKQHVADDYAKIMDMAFMDSGEKINKHISTLLSKDNTKPIQLNLKQCLLRNISICDETKKSRFNVVLYNPSSTAVKYPVRLPVSLLDYVITDSDGNKVVYQIVPTISRHENAQKYDMTFIANLPPMGIKVFNVRPAEVVSFLLQEENDAYKLGSEGTSVTLDPVTGHLSSVRINDVDITLHHKLLYYKSKQRSGRNSGAYVFRNDGDPIRFNDDGPVKIRVFKGDIFDEVHQEYSSWAKNVIRVYKDQDLADNIEFDWLVGPIPVDDRQGKEVISRFTSKLDSGDTFYTDANGRELLKRIRDKRPSYNFTQTEPASGNYYPVTSEIAITDGKLRLAVLNDRAQGGSSLKSGQIELMVHRATLYDDYWGVGEALNEKENGVGVTARGKHYLTLSHVGQHKVERVLSNKIAFTPWIFIDNTTDAKTITSLKHEFTGLNLNDNVKLPESVRILTLEPIVGENDAVLLRLENYFEDDVGKVQTVSLKGLFESFEVISLEPTNIVANERKKEMKRLNWYQHETPIIQDGNSLEVTLYPQQIKTFIAKVKYGQ